MKIGDDWFRLYVDAAVAAGMPRAAAERKCETCRWYAERMWPLSASVSACARPNPRFLSVPYLRGPRSECQLWGRFWEPRV